MPSPSPTVPPPTTPRPHRRQDKLVWAIVATGVLALLIDPIHFGDTRARPLVPLDGGRIWETSEAFRPDAVAPTTDGHQRPPDLESRGTHAQGAPLQGAERTRWFTTKAKFTVMVCGYPTASGNQLVAEFRRPDGTIVRITYDDPDPQETWEPWFIATPRDCRDGRILAVSGSPNERGWMAFTQPFAIGQPADWQLLAGAQLFCTTCLALVLLAGPGLLWLGSRGNLRGLDLGFAAFIGPLLLAALGLLVWGAGGFASPAGVSRAGVGTLMVLISVRLHRQGSPFERLPPGATAIIAAGVLLAGAAIAKANISIAQRGELYSGLVSRTLEVGGHSDSRISYHLVQIVAHHLPPFAPETSAYFSPWSLTSRGPLAGLLAAPVVLATGADVPRDMPDQPWRPFDRQGFAAYRIVLIVLASLAAWAVYGVGATLAGWRSGLLAGSAALLAPFFLHETFFTWPKLIAAGAALTAFGCAHLRRPFASGLVIGIGYLFHPLPLLSAPFIALWAFAAEWRDGRRLLPAISSLVRFSVGAACLVCTWSWLGTLSPAQDLSQAGFVGYFRLADNATATWSTWVSTRWQNIANTFIPLHLLWFDPAHESINSVYAPSPAAVRAGFLYWNTLPFALGVPLFAAATIAIAQGLVRATHITLVTVLGPAALLVAFWGAADSGMMRHCGHVLFLGVIVFTGWWALRSGGRATLFRSLLLHPWSFAWRGAELTVMALGTTFLNRFPHFAGVFAPGDIGSALVVVGLIIAASTLLARAVRTARVLDPIDHAGLAHAG